MHERPNICRKGKAALAHKIARSVEHVGKLAGAIVLALPKLPRLKEWAYAGFAIDFLGAAASHGLNGDPIDKLFPPLVIFGLLMGSYFLRPDDRRLAD